MKFLRTTKDQYEREINMDIEKAKMTGRRIISELEGETVTLVSNLPDDKLNNAFTGKLALYSNCVGVTTEDGKILKTTGMNSLICGHFTLKQGSKGIGVRQVCTSPIIIELFLK